MDNETKKKINENYQRSLIKGERFWPDSIYKDLVVSLGIFIILVLLATFVGVPGEPKADPSDTSYLPRPEWYFLFLFKFLALFGQIPVLGKIEWIATVLIPAAFLIVLTLLPFIEKSQVRHYSKRVVALSIMGIFVVSAVTLTLLSDVPTGASLEGTMQTVGGLVIPTLAYILLAYFAWKPGAATNKTVISIASVTAVLMVGFTIATLAIYKAPEVEETVVANTLVDQIQAGGDLYAVQCVECHGSDGEVAIITGVEGLEGKEIPPINGKDVLYTLNDASMAEVIAYGRPNGGMNPFGKAYNAEGLSKSEIDNIVIFMRYSWDDRFEAPVMPALYPALAEGEVPSYEKHIAPIVKRYCISCHRPGKDNNEFWMQTYDEILTTGDNGPNVVANDENSTLLALLQGHPLMDGSTELAGQMPPNKLLSADIVEMFRLWIMAGMPNAAAK
jgi:mono/diheme cytochrome c family protein